jgi:predicted nucleic acid-binding protein
VTLCDTGPLVALVDADDPHHERCTETLATLPPEPLLTTWPCLTEALYLVGRGGGLLAQEDLWSYLADGLLVINIPGGEEWQRLRELMNEYHDAPMDFADASRNLLPALPGRSGGRALALRPSTVSIPGKRLGGRTGRTGVRPPGVRRGSHPANEFYKRKNPAPQTRRYHTSIQKHNPVCATANPRGADAPPSR